VKKIVGVFVRFRAPLQQGLLETAEYSNSTDTRFFSTKNLLHWRNAEMLNNRLYSFLGNLEDGSMWRSSAK
jgi:hypothetical protein